MFARARRWRRRDTCWCAWQSRLLLYLRDRRRAVICVLGQGGKVEVDRCARHSPFELNSLAVSHGSVQPSRRLEPPCRPAILWRASGLDLPRQGEPILG